MSINNMELIFVFCHQSICKPAKGDSGNVRHRSNCSGARLDGRRWISLTCSAYGEDASTQMQESSESTVDIVRKDCWAQTETSTADSRIRMKTKKGLSGFIGNSFDII